VTGDRPRLLRPGALPLRLIREVTGPIALPDDAPVDGVHRSSPGMSRRHYAPRARAILAKDVDDVDRVGLPTPVAALTYDTSPGPLGERLPADPREYAADLFAALHRLDDARVGTILIQEPPATEDWLAVRDRLSRAVG
jgi:L-threonylcarbamoyladenylate synthase